VLKCHTKTVTDAMTPMNEVRNMCLWQQEGPTHRGSHAIMMPLQVYALSTDDILNENKMVEIMACGECRVCLARLANPHADKAVWRAGFSRIPVHTPGNRQDVRGFLLVKRLIVLDPDDNRAVRTLPLRLPIVVSPKDSLLELLNIFQVKHTAILITTDNAVEGRDKELGEVSLNKPFAVRRCGYSIHVSQAVGRVWRCAAPVAQA
jgi:hypothetical protein